MDKLPYTFKLNEEPKMALAAIATDTLMEPGIEKKLPPVILEGVKAMLEDMANSDENCVTVTSEGSMRAFIAMIETFKKAMEARNNE